MLNKEEAIYAAAFELVGNNNVTVQVEHGEDKYGVFVRVHYDSKISSKIRYKHIL